MGSHQNGFLKLKCLSPLKMLTSPLFEETFGASLSFFSPSLEDLGILMIFEEKITFFKNFFSNGFNILAVDAYFEMELCTTTWLNHDYGDGGVVDILEVDAFSGVDVANIYG
jgi:hypothetical protein